MEVSPSTLEADVFFALLMDNDFEELDLVTKSDVIVWYERTNNYFDNLNYLKSLRSSIDLEEYNSIFRNLGVIETVFRRCYETNR